MSSTAGFPKFPQMDGMGVQGAFGALHTHPRLTIGEGRTEEIRIPANGPWRIQAALPPPAMPQRLRG